MNHILNACSTSLNQGRFTWRHDSVLQKLVRGIIPDHRACDNPPATMPQSIVSTSARPDIVVIHGNKITLIELTVPYNSPEALSNARLRKRNGLRKRNEENYQLVLSELDRKGFQASLITLEISALGHSLPQTHSDLEWSPLPHQE